MLRESLAVSVGWFGISMVVDGLPALLLPHRLLADGGTDASTLGLITLVAIGVAALVQPMAGRLSDRVGRFPIIAAGTGVAVLGLGLLVAPGGAVVGIMLALAGVSVAQAGQQALLPDRIGSAWRGRASGLKGAFDLAGAFAGFLILAALLGAGEIVLAAGALAAALIIGTALSWVLVRPRVDMSDTVAALAEPAFHPTDAARLARLVVARFFVLLGIFAVGRFLVLFVADRFELGADAAGAEAGGVLAILALVTIAVSIPGGWLADRIGRRPLMLAGGAIAAAGIALLPVAESLESLLAFGSLMAVGSATFGSASWAMLSDLTPPADAGRLMGFANFGTAGAAAAAGAFGFLVDGGGFGPAFLVAATCALAGAALAWTLADTRQPAERLIGSPEGVN